MNIFNFCFVKILMQIYVVRNKDYSKVFSVLKYLYFIIMSNSYESLKLNLIWSTFT